MSGAAPLALLSASDGSWLLASRRPHGVLARYVRSYQGYEEYRPSLVRRRELPHGGVVLVVNFGAKWLVADPRCPTRGQTFDSFAAGIDDFASLVACEARAHCLQIDFTPTGARRFFNLPMHHLARTVIALDDLIGRDCERLADRLHQAPDWCARFDIVDQFILGRLATAPAEDTGVIWAWNRLAERGGLCSIATLAQELGCSRKHLAALFRDQIGMPPKAVAGIMRFSRAVEMIAAAPQPDLARIAQDAGYFDQPHFNRDFLALSGITPGEFLRARLADGDGVAA